jgi:hypothetical protein
MKHPDGHWQYSDVTTSNTHLITGVVTSYSIPPGTVTGITISTATNTADPATISHS